MKTKSTKRGIANNPLVKQSLPSAVEMLADFVEYITKNKMDTEETLRLRKELVKDEARRWLEKRGNVV